MNRLYLVRHGRVYPPDKSICIGSLSDPSLTAEGEAQCRTASGWFNYHKVSKVFTSPMRRCVESAGLIFDMPAGVNSGLTELGMGEWDGLEFSEIKSRYPQLHARRGLDPSLTPPEGEELLYAQTRFASAVEAIIQERDGEEDIALVSHAGVIRLFLCQILGLDARDFLKLSIPYGSVITLEIEKGKLSYLGKVTPTKVPDEKEIQRLYDLAQTPPEAIEHCKSVAQMALDICCDLENKGYLLDTQLVFASALLHDFCRTRKHHHSHAAGFMEAQGYETAAEIIAVHMELPGEDERICESAILYLADKLVSGTVRVSLDERFSRSQKKCLGAKAKKEHARKWAQAKRIYEILIKP